MAGDPWHVVKTEITNTLGQVERLHTAARALSGQAALQHKEKIESLLSTADLDLNDLQETITIVEAQRERFHISDHELESRRAFVRTTTALIATTREEIGRLDVAGASSSSSVPPPASAGVAPAQDLGPDNESEGLLSGDSKASKQSKAAKASRRQQEIAAANDEAVSQFGAQQQLQLEAQDEVLDDLHGAVQRVKSMAGQMNEELAQQNRMIGSLEEQMDHVSSTMGSLKRKMTEMAKSKDRGKYCAILWLSLLLFLLIMLVMYD
jgi:hypothetical protein